MSRFPALLATMTLGLALLPAVGVAQTSEQAAAPVARPADAATRANYDRADALSRSVFWGEQHQINPLDREAGVKLAQALRELGQYDQAAQTAQTVLTLQPRNIDAMLEIGRAQIARGQAFYGIAALEQARDQNPRDWRPLSLLGVAYQQVRRPAEAQQAWASALTLSPENPDVLANAAMAQMAGGNATEAEALLRRAVSQPAASLKVRQNLALVLGLQGKMGEAENILRRDQPPEIAEANLNWLQQRLQDNETATAATARVWPTGG
jgi:Flp pilus assembly protein TadD